MKKPGRRRPSAKSGEADLAAGRREQTRAANHEADLLLPVVHGDRELVRPVAVPIANQQIGALLRRFLDLRSKPCVHEFLDTRIHPNPPAIAVRQRDPEIAAPAWIAELPGWRRSEE